MDLYKESWELYKGHSSKFTDDFQYYADFCKQNPTLELFAGYGRLTNFLAAQGIDIESVELSPDFSAHIQIPEEKRHLGDVTEFRLDKKFRRIIAGYNSFCLITDPKLIAKFFRNVAALLVPNGRASFSYYHPDAWKSATGDDFIYKNEIVTYDPSHDLSQRDAKHGVWIDRYKYQNQTITFDYPVRIYESEIDLVPFLKDTNLKIIDVIYNYNNSEISEDGWQEYILQKF